MNHPTYYFVELRTKDRLKPTYFGKKGRFTATHNREAIEQEGYKSWWEAHCQARIYRKNEKAFGRSYGVATCIIK